MISPNQAGLPEGHLLRQRASEPASGRRSCSSSRWLASIQPTPLVAQLLRDFAAWLGLVPKQMSTGDRTILGRITKRGNRHLRMLFIQGARAILLRPASWAKHIGFSS